MKTILLVDDEPPLRLLVHTTLVDPDLRIIEATDGAEAARLALSEHPDLIVLDWMMPGMSGIEVAEKVKASQPWLPVVIVTGYGTEENEARARTAGVSGFLHKPLSPEMIEESTHRALLERDAVPAPQAAPELVAAPPKAEPKAEPRGVLKSLVLFAAAPFIGLFYLVVGPFVGLAMLAWMGIKAIAENRMARKAAGFVKNVVLFLAAPFIGLLYALLFPFIGLGMLAWNGVKALTNRAQPQ